MRAFGFDFLEFIRGVKSFLSEFKNPMDIIDFIIEVNELKSVLVELYMQEETEKSIIDFLNLIEEKIQFDLNRLSSQVKLLEDEIEKGGISPLDDSD